MPAVMKGGSQFSLILADSTFIQFERMMDIVLQ